MERVLRSFWIRSWSEDKDVHTADDIIAVGRSAGMDEEAITCCLAAMKTDPVKTALKVLMIKYLYMACCLNIKYLISNLYYIYNFYAEK